MSPLAPPAAFLGSGLLFFAGDEPDAPPERFGGLPRPRVAAAFFAPLASATGAGAAFFGDSFAGAGAGAGFVGFAGAAP